MDLSDWALYALTAVAALAMVTYLYRRRELPGRGRKVLAGLRWATLSLLLLLLFDPDLPTSPLGLGSERPQVILDGSLSMTMPRDTHGSATRWDAAVAEARRVAGGGNVLVFGDRPEVVPADSLTNYQPGAPRSMLAPALRAAAEAGARRVVVLTDGGIDDLSEVDRILPLLGLRLEVRYQGDNGIGNRALAEVDAPLWGEVGEPLEVRVGVGAVGPVPDSVGVVIRQGERVVAEGMVETPEPGRLSTLSLTFTPEGSAGEVIRYDLALIGEDAVPDDDERSIYIQLDEEPAGVAIVSFRADWELRFLQPVLTQSLGLPVHGFLQGVPGRYIRLASGSETGLPVEESEVRRTLDRARIVVLHGLDDGAPAWAIEAARKARRALIFPAGTGASGLPLPSAQPIGGAWSATGTIPASPVAEALAGLETDLLPPLTSVRPVDLPAGAWAPLLAGEGSGPGRPLAVGLEGEGRRTIVSLADGYWRWAFQEGKPRQAYRRLWSALGGWLLEDDSGDVAGPLRPLDRVVPRGAAVRWVGMGQPTSTTDSSLTSPVPTQLRVSSTDGGMVMDTVIETSPGDTLVLPALPPGRYHYEAVLASSGAGTGEDSSGEFVVESYSPEFLRRSVDIEEVDAATSADRGPLRLAGPSRPLHTSAWPYLLLALLISLEWTLRRRWGLR